MAAYHSTGFRSGSHDHHLADTFYGTLPVSALAPDSADIPAASIPSKLFQKAKSGAAKRKGAGSDDICRPGILLGTKNERNYWTAAKGGKRGRVENQKAAEIELHQSTCLNLNGSDNNEAELWILPDFEEWELDTESSKQPSMRREGEWAPLVQRAVNSNRERLRRRLEGDGWDFVGGKYGEGEVAHETQSVSEESVDEEFDVVILEVS
ncbi:hypothetical protein K469DRAFT_694282 [Zopfia rhizophila CBS 207.26]|uniref:Uncharacterized protein n=1 Tax=Zopfia rhizophila CBS 207.26 TaxID=1314779 RepID=A0A6A6EMF6_9PEZI|nr:hypothetical protein K469DRAFT_694282 [Zopfia rhizophila CBS 207.26]